MILEGGERQTDKTDRHRLVILVCVTPTRDISTASAWCIGRHSNQLSCPARAPPSFLWDNFTGHRILGWLIFIFCQHLNILLHSFLAWMVSEEQSDIILIFVPLEVRCLFSSDFFRISPVYPWFYIVWEWYVVVLVFYSLVFCELSGSHSFGVWQ